MKFLLYHERPDLPYVGCEPPRAYYIPFESAVNAYSRDRGCSGRALFLSGAWGFGYFDSPGAIPDDFITCDPAPLPQISVPACMEMEGYGEALCTGGRLPFPSYPPRVPDRNPTGVYLRRFALHKSERACKRVYLVLEGAASCFYVWVNGKFRGYGSGSSAAEIDITGALHDGENTLAVAVLRFCAGSYLESWDRQRFSGLFREVYLLFRPERHLRDYFVTTKLMQGGTQAELVCSLSMRGDAPVVGTLVSPEGHILDKAAGKDGAVKVTVDRPLLWSAERPTLYTLILECEGEYIAQKVGIRTLSTEGGGLRLNGGPVTLRGVNWQEADPRRGSAAELSHMTRDLLLMKRHNINAVRLSRPADPRFLQLCDELGLYVMACADYDASPKACGHSRFEKTVQEQVERLVERDKNHPCVVGWNPVRGSGQGTIERRAMHQIEEGTLCESFAHTWTAEAGCPGPDTGLLTLGRAPRARLIHLKNAFAPARFEAVDLAAGALTVYNNLDTSDLSELECIWEVSRDGRPAEWGSAGALAVPTHSGAELTLPYNLPENGRCFLRLSLNYRRETLWATEGYEACFAQFELPVQASIHTVTRTGNISLREKQETLQLVGESFVYELDRETALFCTMKAYGRKLLEAPVRWLVPESAVRGLSAEREENGSVTIAARLTRPEGAETQLSWRVYPDGLLEYQTEGAGADMALFLPLKYERVRYFGLGPVESGQNLTVGVYRGEFTLHAQEMSGGNRWATEWAALCDEEGCGLWLGTSGRFDFSVKTDPQEGYHMVRLSEIPFLRLCPLTPGDLSQPWRLAREKIV